MSSPEDTPDAGEQLRHVPEWCTADAAEIEHGIHDSTCPDSAMVLTKAQFVAAQESAATAAIEAYRILVEDETDWSEEDMLDSVLVEAQEGAMCFAGIGSCGRGWCKHS